MRYHMRIETITHGPEDPEVGVRYDGAPILRARPYALEIETRYARLVIYCDRDGLEGIAATIRAHLSEQDRQSDEQQQIADVRGVDEYERSDAPASCPSPRNMPTWGDVAGLMG